MRTHARAPQPASDARPRFATAVRPPSPVNGAAGDHDARAPVQPRLLLGPVTDAFEAEAEAVAARVVRSPAPRQGAPLHPGCTCGGTCARCRKAAADRVRTLRLPSGSHVEGAVPDIVEQAASTDGRPLDPATRTFMETRFGHDFADVRIHSGPRAEAAALSIGAYAYTTGNDIVFGRDAYAPWRESGMRLLAHELTHVVQQGAAAPRLIQRATFNVGSLTINVDYGGLASIPAADLVSAVESRFIAFTGAADASAIHATLVALTPAQQRWVLYALDLHQDNVQSPRDARLDRTVAVQRLIAHAPSAAHTFPGALGPPEEEALRASGFFEVALTGGLTPPDAPFARAVDLVLNPPASSGGPVPALDVARFHARLEPAVRHLLNFIDPAAWTSTGTQSIGTLQSIGDDIMGEAKDFFSPFAHTARESVLGVPGFAISANIFSVTPLVPDQDTRLSYLENRSTIVGRNTSSHARFSDKNIFSEVHFDGSRAADQLEMEKLVAKLEGEAAVAAQVDRLIQHTGRQEGSGASTKIGLSTEFDAGRFTECRARWNTVETICHEIMHALAHPAVETEAAAVGFGQVIVEGMAEVLSTQLFNDRVRPKAKSTPAFKAKLEAGIAGAPCKEPPEADIGYAAAGSGAETIRKLVGDQRYRSAFFLGQMHLLGR